MQPLDKHINFLMEGLLNEVVHSVVINERLERVIAPMLECSRHSETLSLQLSTCSVDPGVVHLRNDHCRSLWVVISSEEG